MTITDANRGKLQAQFGTWLELIAPFIESTAWDSIIGTLKATTAANKEVYPASSELFKSFALCNRNKLKAIVITGGPYANKLQGKIIANGIPYDSSNVKYDQPVLYNWYQAYEKDYGFDPDNDLSLDLSYLLTQEHVLLIGSSLTVETQKPEIHAQLWEPMWKYIIEEIINQYYRGLPIVLIGLQAGKLEKYIAPMLHHVLKVEDPQTAVQYNRPWKSDGMFSFCNRILAANNSSGYQNEIRWVRKKNENKDEKVPWSTVDENQTIGELPWQQKR